MTNLPNNLDEFQRINDETRAKGLHKDLHNTLAETLEAVQKHSGSLQVTALPANSEVGSVYTLTEIDGDNTPGIYLCTGGNPMYKKVGGVNLKEGGGLKYDGEALEINKINPDNVGFYTGKLEGGDSHIQFEIDEILLVAGGGGAGSGSNTGTYYKGGGGGAGGLIHKTTPTLIDKKTISVIIGAGGLGAQSDAEGGQTGGDTLFDFLTAKGGGAGGRASGGGGNGGSGGGGGSQRSGYMPKSGQGIQSIQSGDSGLFGFGREGGIVNAGKPSSGGGATGPGVQPSDYGNTVAGGAGKTVFGSLYSVGGPIANSVSHAMPNTGNGGGTDNEAGYDSRGSNGGSGIVKIKYLTSKAEGLTITGGIITTEGLYTYHTFTENGTFTVSGTKIAAFKTLGEGANDGAFSANIDGVSYSDVVVDLSASQTLVDVATAVQSAIRARTGNLETCEWTGTNFIIKSVTPGNDSAILKLTAPTTGTDISGADYLDLGADATEAFGNDDAFRVVILDEEGKIKSQLVENNTGANIVTSGRAINTVYQNTKKVPIFVNASVKQQSAIGSGVPEIHAKIGATSTPATSVARYTCSESGSSMAQTIPMSFIVPAGYYYTVATVNGYNGSPALISWFECDLI